jgi:hypothetical protein
VRPRTRRTKDDKDEGKLAGFLPGDFEKLAPSDAQKQKVYKLRAE